MVGGRANTRQVAPIDVLIAERIRAHRRVQNISQTALAGKLGVTFQQVQKYEKGVNRVGAGRLYQLAKIFGVPVQALFPENSDARMEPGCNDAQLISKFALSADGWRLCHAFLSITDPKKRKSIVALVQQMANSQSPED